LVDLAVEPLLDSFRESHPNMDPASSVNPISFSEHPDSVASAAIKEAPSRDLGPALIWVYPKTIREIDSSDPELFNQFQSLRLTDRVSEDHLDLIGPDAELREFCVPPTTHFVTTIDDLTDTLDFDSDGIDDMGQQVEDSLFATSPVTPTCTGKWEPHRPMTYIWLTPHEVKGNSRSRITLGVRAPVRSLNTMGEEPTPKTVWGAMEN
jgi:hypothetical protein